MNALVTFRTHDIGSQTPILTQLTSGNGQSLATKSALATKSTTSTTTDSSEEDEDVLGVNAFLDLLVLQLQNQDPLDPMDNSEMLSQLAQFSSLEQMNGLNESFEEFSGNIDQLNFISATGLVGQYVSGVNTDGDELEGIVESVHLDGSIVYLTVEGELMSMAGVMNISAPTETTDTSETAETTE